MYLIWLINLLISDDIHTHKHAHLHTCPHTHTHVLIVEVSSAIIRKSYDILLT